jgi:undecaprenyl-diphosphatase
MELEFLQALYSIHNPILDTIMTLITHLGDAGIFWIVIAVVLTCTKKYRKAGIAALVSLVLSLIFTNGILKNLFDRPRPYTFDESVKLLIATPHDSSFPSGHSSASMAAAFSFFLYNKKIGIPAIVLALLIAFSRLYIFVHYPTDVLVGLIVGTIYAVTAAWIVNKIYIKKGLEQ